MNKSKHFPSPEALKQKSSILMPCPKHKRLPDMTVCSQCAAEMGEFCAVAQDTLQLMPVVYGELFSEGMAYFAALEAIADSSEVCDCLFVNGRQGHEPNCPKNIAVEALKGFEGRILHRPASGRLQMLQDDAKARVAANPDQMPDTQAEPKPFKETNKGEVHEDTLDGEPTPGIKLVKE